MLNIIYQKEVPDSGTVWLHKDIKLVMLQQENEFDENKSIWDNILSMNNPMAEAVKKYEQYLERKIEDNALLESLIAKMDELEAWNFENQMQQILSKLQIHNLNQQVGSLSGGQKKRIALAQALIETEIYHNKCLLILDEPTNHLDVSMIEWLEEFLSAKRVTLLMVSHDRYFLDAVCNEIIEIEDKKVYTHKGDYDYFLQQKAHRLEVQGSELQKDKNIYRKELEWMRKQPKARTTKSKSRQDAFADVEERVKQKVADTDVQLQVKMTRLGGKILEMKKVYKSYGDKAILKGFDYTFKKGERIGIIGKNGVGKSTFLQIALHQLEPDSGKINHGDTVVFGHFAQTGLSYTEDKRVIEYVKDMAEFFPLADGTKLSASKFLERFAFTAEQQYTYLSKLSGGEKRRLQLLSILFKNPNFLVLDEPTNDLDLQTLQILEEFLMEYQGCILLVSHDRYFMDKLVDHLFVFEGDGVVSDFPGNYSQYRIKELESSKADKVATASKVESTASTPSKNNKERKASYKERREYESLEGELKALEKEKETHTALLNDSSLPYPQIQAASERITELIQLIEEKEMRWLELSELMEE